MSRLLPRLRRPAARCALGGLRRPARRRRGQGAVGALLGGVLGFAASSLFDALRGWRLLRWLRGAQDGRRRRATRGLWGEVGYRIERSAARPSASGRGRALRLAHSSPAMEALAERRPAARRRRPDRVVQLARRRSLRPRPAARPAPARHQPDPLAGVRRLPAGRRLRRAGHLPRRRAAPGSLQVTIRPTATTASCVLVAGPDRARARRGDAARLRRQRLARDPHAAHRAVGLSRDAAQPAARPRPSRSA